MSSLDSKLQVWSRRLRLLSYAFGVIGMVLMMLAQKMADPERSAWAQRSFVCLGLMFCGFVTYYMLSVLRMYRR